MLSRTLYWAMRVCGAIYRRVGMRIAGRLHRATCAVVGTGTRFQTGVRFAQPAAVRIGRDCLLCRGVGVASELGAGRLLIADHVQINRDVHLDITGGLEIGERAMISEGVVIYTHDHGLDPRSAPILVPKVIGQGVWIGTRAVILPGCRMIGAGAVIGAGAIVTRDVPCGVIVAGNPAQIVRHLATRGVAA